MMVIDICNFFESELNSKVLRVYSQTCTHYYFTYYHNSNDFVIYGPYTLLALLHINKNITRMSY